VHAEHSEPPGPVVVVFPLHVGALCDPELLLQPTITANPAVTTAASTLRMFMDPS
jgi:hypothetical protein